MTSEPGLVVRLGLRGGGEGGEGVLKPFPRFFAHKKVTVKEIKKIRTEEKREKKARKTQHYHQTLIYLT